MAGKKIEEAKTSFKTKLKVGDPVMLISGGNSLNPNKGGKGKVGKILRLLPKKGRVVVEGVNMIKRHQKANAMNEASGIIDKEGSVSISNVMFYQEDLKRPVRLTYQRLDDGRKVRGFLHPETNKFEQIDV